MSYVVSNQEMSRDSGIALVGCGGTGGFVAEGLCRLLRDKDTTLLLIDHDRVEERNLRRQNFYEHDIGKFKAQALAERLARLYGRQVAYCVYPYTPDIIDQVFVSRHYRRGMDGLLIACVDNPAARKSIAMAHRGWSWWIDAGNGDYSGQVLIGNVKEPEHMKDAFLSKEEIVERLPMPTLQQPALLAPVPKAKRRDMSCAEAVEADVQSPIINQAMATLVLEFVSRLIAGTLGWMGAYIDLELGSLSPVPADPETVARMVGVRVDQLVSNKTLGEAPLCQNCGRHHW